VLCFCVLPSSLSHLSLSLSSAPLSRDLTSCMEAGLAKELRSITSPHGLRCEKVEVAYSRRRPPTMERWPAMALCCCGVNAAIADPAAGAGAAAAISLVGPLQLLVLSRLRSARVSVGLGG
jgi:hypothetical protein